jgi:hypothetical protein
LLALIVGELQELKETVVKIQQDCKAVHDRIENQHKKIKALEIELVELKEAVVKIQEDCKAVHDRIENQDKKIENQDKKIKALEIELVFVDQALEFLLQGEGVILAAQILLIKLGRQPRIMDPLRFCRNAYHSTTGYGTFYGAPFVAMVEEEFPDEPVPKLYDEMDIILTLRNNYACTSPVEDVVSQSMKLVSYMTHSGGKDKLNRRDLLVLRILEKAESLLKKYPCCVPPPPRT